MSELCKEHDWNERLLESDACCSFGRISNWLQVCKNCNSVRTITTGAYGKECFVSEPEFKTEEEIKKIVEKKREPYRRESEIFSSIQIELEKKLIEIEREFPVKKEKTFFQKISSFFMPVV